MSAGFDFDGETFWGTNGSVELYLETLAAIAARSLGAEDPLALFFREEREAFFMGKVVFLDECLGSADARERFVRMLDEATTELLQREAFTEYGREWVRIVVGGLRLKVVGVTAG